MSATILVGCWQDHLSFPEVASSKQSRTSLVVQWVKDPAVSLLWFRSLLGCGLDPWSWNFCMSHEGPKKKKKSSPVVRLETWRDVLPHWVHHLSIITAQQTRSCRGRAEWSTALFPPSRSYSGCNYGPYLRDGET